MAVLLLAGAAALGEMPARVADPGPGLLLVVDAAGPVVSPAPTRGEILSLTGNRTHVLVRGASFSWLRETAPSPDGRYLAFPNGDLFALSMAGGPYIRLTHAPLSRFRNPLMVYGVAAWSPDGRVLAYGVSLATDVVSGNEDRTGLWLLPLHGRRPAGSPRQLSHALPGRLSWSPSGRTLVVSGYVKNAAVVTTVDRVSGASQILLHGEDAAVSQTSGQIAYVTGTVAGGVQQGVARLWVSDAHGHHARLLLSSVMGAILSPAWSPDGTRIAYVGSARVYGGGRAIHILDLRTGGDRVVLRADQANRRLIRPGFFVSVAWSR
jgi:Tol biopolymer transport system component